MSARKAAGAEIRPMTDDELDTLPVLRRCLAGCGHYWPPRFLDDHGDCPECRGIEWIEATVEAAHGADAQPDPLEALEPFGPLFGAIR